MSLRRDPSPFQVRHVSITPWCTVTRWIKLDCELMWSIRIMVYASGPRPLDPLRRDQTRPGVSNFRFGPDSGHFNGTRARPLKWYGGVMWPAGSWFSLYGLRTRFNPQGQWLSEWRGGGTLTMHNLCFMSTPTLTLSHRQSAPRLLYSRGFRILESFAFSSLFKNLIPREALKFWTENFLCSLFILDQKCLLQKEPQCYL